MTFTKIAALHDRITIDGSDYSNAFRTFGFTSDANTVDVSGFSVSGTDETLMGSKAQGFSGDVYVTKETVAFLWALHSNNTTFEVAWQPNGLVDSSVTTFHANCQLRTFDPTDTRGDASVAPVTFSVADSTGISTT